MTTELLEVELPGGIFEEDIEEITTRSINEFGPQGRYLPSNQLNIHAIRVYSPKFGTIWYGDLEVNKLHKVKNMSAEFETVFYIVNDIVFNNFMRSEPWSLSYKSLIESEAAFDNGRIVKLYFDENMIG